MDHMDIEYYSSRLEIDLDKIGQNLEKIRAYTKSLEIMPVIKGNAYGFGTVAIADYLVHDCGIRMLAVARVFEACQILDAGCTEAGILILGPVPDCAIPIVVSRDLQIPLFRKETAKRLSDEARRQGKDFVKAHLKIETGLNRIGVRPGEELAELLSYVKQLGNVVIDGVFTHFATADQANEGRGNAFTREQLAIFCEGLTQIKEFGIRPSMVHCCNTCATSWLKEAYPLCTHVRVGSLYLGYSPVQDDWNPVGVEESGSWKTSIVNLRLIKPGETVGYGRAFQPHTPTLVATIGVGYGDGYLQSLAVQGAPALVHGVRCKFVGTCMDMSFLDVTGVDCKIGDEVTLFGADDFGNRLSGIEIGHLLGATRNTMFSHITERVGRVYLRKQK